jgi:hypothetical protein
LASVFSSSSAPRSPRACRARSWNRSNPVSSATRWTPGVTAIAPRGNLMRWLVILCLPFMIRKRLFGLPEDLLPRVGQL